MENYLMLNGKRIDLAEEQVKTLTAEEKKNPFVRVENKDYFFICASGEVLNTTEDHTDVDDKNYDVANYCTDKAMMEQRALHETLNRLLWRYSEEHGGDNEWDTVRGHHYIGIAYNNIFSFGTSTVKTQGVVYFKYEEIARAAIEEIVKPFMEKHPEFVW